MEQFIGLIIFLVAWGIISTIRKAAKKQQAAMEQIKKGQQQSQPTNMPTSTVDEINKLIEMFTGSQSVTPQYTPATLSVNTDNESSIETSVEEGGVETTPPSYSSIDTYIPYSSVLDEPTSEENLHTVLTQPIGSENILNWEINQSNPVLSYFDMRKAVIYSTILEPKYF